MTVLHTESHWDLSNVRFAFGRVTLYEKGGINADFIDYGLCVLARSVTEERIPFSASADLADLYRELSVEGRLAGYEVCERFYEVGSAQGLVELGNHLTAKDT